MKIGLVLNPESPATDYYRIIPWTKLGYDYHLINPTAVTWTDFVQCDVVVFQRPNGSTILTMIQECKNLGKKIIVDHDDLLHEVNQANPAFNHFKNDNVRQSIIDSFQMADWCVCSTPIIQKYYGTSKLDDGKPVYDIDRMTVIPNGIDLNVTPLQKPFQNNNPIRILWRGSMTHVGDLRTIEPFWTWVQQQQNFEAAFIGMAMFFKDIYYPKIKCVEWMQSPFQYFKLIQDVKADYGIFPLTLDLFNLAKSNNFAMELLVNGIVPYIQTGFHEFDHPGVRFYTSADDLIEQMKANAKGDVNRDKDVLDGQDWIYQNRQVKVLNQLRKQVIESLW